MGNPLQIRRSAAERAADQQAIEFTDKISSFAGLVEIVEADLGALDSAKIPRGWRDSPVRIELQFGFTDASASVPRVTGQIESEVHAVCQRCLEPFQLALSVEPRLMLLPQEDVTGDAEGDQNDHLNDGQDGEGFEVWELEDNALRVQDIVEELLILAMPFSAMHSNARECKALSTQDEIAEEMTRPFAALRAQMDGD